MLRRPGDDGSTVDSGRLDLTPVVLAHEQPFHIVASPTARAQLDRRIGAAIEQVCGNFAAIESAQEPEVAACWMRARTSVDQRLAGLTVTSELKFAAK